MISLEDCVALSGLTEAQVLAIAEHEHLPEIAATEIRDMIVDDIRQAQQRQDKAHVLTLLHALHHFLKSHPAARITSAPRLICGNPSQLFPWVGCAGRHGFLSSMPVAEPAA